MSHVSRWAVSCAVAALCVASTQWMTARVGPLSSRTAQAAPATSGPDMTFALTGDSIITMKLSVHTEPEFLRMIDLIRGADVALTNLEVLLHDYEPPPSTESGGTYMRAEPEMAKELVWAGFDMVARANNHAYDYGAEGMRLTTKYVAAAGLVQAGVGESLREAREAKFLDTNKGRVALISVASTFSDQGRAGDSWGDTKPRPGLNPLRFKTTYVLPRAEFDALRRALAGAGQLRSSDDDSEPAHTGGPATELTVFRRHFVVGDKRQTRTEPLKEDLDAVAAVVSNASRQADWTIVSSHTHEGGVDRFTPPEFFVTFAHAMIEAGADIVTASGPHVLRGIEIYKGKPIFYGLGDFIFENETLLRQPPENYEELGLTRDSGVADFNDRRFERGRSGFPADEPVWESVIAVPRFAGKQLAELKLYPISLGFGRPRPDRGWPVLAAPALAAKIIGDMRTVSSHLGTSVEFKDGIGMVNLGRPRSEQ